MLDKVDKEPEHICILEHDVLFKRKLEIGLKAIKKLKVVLCVCLFFMVCEIFGGLLSGSLAILTDAAHMCSDVAGFGISIISIYIA